MSPEIDSDHPDHQTYPVAESCGGWEDLGSESETRLESRPAAERLAKSVNRHEPWPPRL